MIIALHRVGSVIVDEHAISTIAITVADVSYLVKTVIAMVVTVAIVAVSWGAVAKFSLKACTLVVA